MPSSGWRAHEGLRVGLEQHRRLAVLFFGDGAELEAVRAKFIDQRVGVVVGNRHAIKASAVPARIQDLPRPRHDSPMRRRWPRRVAMTCQRAARGGAQTPSTCRACSFVIGAKRRLSCREVRATSVGGVRRGHAPRGPGHRRFHPLEDGRSVRRQLTPSGRAWAGPEHGQRPFLSEKAFAEMRGLPARRARPFELIAEFHGCWARNSTPQPSQVGKHQERVPDDP